MLTSHTSESRGRQSRLSNDCLIILVGSDRRSYFSRYPGPRAFKDLQIKTRIFNWAQKQTGSQFHCSLQMWGFQNSHSSPIHFSARTILAIELFFPMMWMGLCIGALCKHRIPVLSDVGGVKTLLQHAGDGVWGMKYIAGAKKAENFYKSMSPSKLNTFW